MNAAAFLIFALFFHRSCCDKSRNIVFVKIAFSACVLKKVGQNEAGFELTAELFFKCVRKLKTAVVRFKEFSVFPVFNRIKRKSESEFLFVVVKSVAKSVVKAGKENSAFF